MNFPILNKKTSTKNSSQVRNPENKRNNSCPRKSMLIGYWHQMAIPEDIHVSNIIQIEQAIFRNTYVYANIYS